MTDYIDANFTAIYKAVLGEHSSKQGHELRFGKKGSLSVVLAGEKKGQWYSHESGEGGGPVQLLMSSEHGFGLDYKSAVSAANRITGNVTKDGIENNRSSESRTPTTENRIALAQKIWNHSKEIKGTLGERYLRETRGITCDLSAFKFAQNYIDPVSNKRFPAVLIACKDESSRITAVQAIFLDEKTGNKTEELKANKKVFGVLKGSVARINEGSSEIWIAEGPETAASILSAKPNASVYATLGSLSNAKSLAYLAKQKNTNKINFAVDYDAENKIPQRALDKAIAELRQEGIDCFTARPLDFGEHKRDFNDVLREHGADAVLKKLGTLENKDPNYQSNPFENLKPFKIIDECNIPPREWLILGRLLRSELTITAAAGATGKSLYTLQEALTIATGKLCGVSNIQDTGKVLLLTAEEGEMELQRRLRAVMKHFNIDENEVNKNLIILTPRNAEIRFGFRVKGESIIDALMADRMIEFIKKEKIVYASIDPLVDYHGLDENCNESMNLLMLSLKRIAEETNCAINITHHNRKSGQNENMSVDLVRGAGALTNKARIVNMMGTMSVKECEKYDIPEDERVYYVKFMNGKNNLAIDSAQQWFRKETVKLLSGDEMGVLTQWDSPDTVEIIKGVKSFHLDSIINEISSRSENGKNFSEPEIVEFMQKSPFLFSKPVCKTLLDYLISSGQARIIETENENGTKVNSLYI